ncbi:uncharacterized protein RCC_05418 [Ramularia collo-cygni]|uniref:Methyltransferase n=1 Tax=Ramularia collo-cygni TaxID=112498 RepID=A0A2D3V4E8_9PEZI|nr:uncharacterized protein RCC_05418 [Ramularia collo-cygni]CZT19567.1 uncharacterized protein RCC_05418 [Ramularia collo-cygni]
MSGTPQPVNNSLSLVHGRYFSRFGLENNIHCVPVDERQERRYDEINDVLRQLLGRTVLPPDLHLDSVEDPEVLECGFGKGAWIDDLLKENDQLEIEVIGVDIFTGKGNNGDDSESPEESGSEEEGIEEYIKTRFNMNAPFREERSGSLRPEKFHLVNSRLLIDGINASRWPAFVKDLKAVLCPGGWLQMVEFHPLVQSFSGRDAPFLDRWSQTYMRTLEQMGKEPRCGPRLNQYMRDAGFEHIHSHAEVLPIGPWKEGRASLGNDCLAVIKDMIGSVSLWGLLQVAGMSSDEYRALIAGAQAELLKRELKLYFNVYVSYGQRPGSSRRR